MSTSDLVVLAIFDGNGELPMTASQVAAQVNIVRKRTNLAPLTDRAMRKTLMEMERNGVLDKEVDEQRVERFKRRMARYAFGMEDGHWRILRLGVSTTGATISFLKDDMTEAEARCCATALNALERQATALLRRR